MDGPADEIRADWQGGLDKASHCSTSVLVEVETLGMARSLGWKVHMRCADGYGGGHEVRPAMPIGRGSSSSTASPSPEASRGRSAVAATLRGRLRSTMIRSTRPPPAATGINAKFWLRERPNFVDQPSLASDSTALLAAHLAPFYPEERHNLRVV